MPYLPAGTRLFSMYVTEVKDIHTYPSTRSDRFCQMIAFQCQTPCPCRIRSNFPHSPTMLVSMCRNLRNLPAGHLCPATEAAHLFAAIQWVRLLRLRSSNAGLTGRQRTERNTLDSEFQTQHVWHLTYEKRKSPNEPSKGRTGIETLKRYRHGNGKRWHHTTHTMIIPTWLRSHLSGVASGRWWWYGNDRFMVDRVINWKPPEIY